MASVNKAILIGNLGKDPEVRYTQSGDAVCNFSIATTERWKDKSSGEMNEKTEWHNIAVFGRAAENCGEYLKKGSPVYIEGRLQTRKWTDKDGNDRYTTEVVGDRIQFLGQRQGEERAPARNAPPPKQSGPAKPSKKSDDFDDDIPF